MVVCMCQDLFFSRLMGLPDLMVWIFFLSYLDWNNSSMFNSYLQTGFLHITCALFFFLTSKFCSWPAFSFLTASFLVVCYCGWFTARVDGSRVEDQAGRGSCSWEANHFAFIGRLVSTLRCFCKFRNDTFFLFLFLIHGFNLWFFFWAFTGTQQRGENYGDRWAHWMCHEWSNCRCTDPCGTWSCWDSGCHLPGPFLLTHT